MTQRTHEFFVLTECGEMRCQIATTRSDDIVLTLFPTNKQQSISGVLGACHLSKPLFPELEVAPSAIISPENEPYIFLQNKGGADCAYPKGLKKEWDKLVANLTERVGNIRKPLSFTEPGVEPQPNEDTQTGASAVTKIERRRNSGPSGQWL